MTAAELQAYIHESIPMTMHMQVSVREITAEYIELRAPLSANANHHDDAFGGSIASLAVLCGWSLLHHKTTQSGLDCSLVVQKTSMEYLSPVKTDFTAHCKTPEAMCWDRFCRTLQKHKKARIELQVEVFSNATLCAQLTASYAAKSV